MNHYQHLALLALLAATGAYAATPCETLASLAFPDARIERAHTVADPAPHCRVDGVIGRNIGFSVWLPDEWNGRFVMGGAGGFVARDDNQALRFGHNVLEAGYATASTNTGHTSDGMDASWALDDYEAIVNYAHVGVHRAVVHAKDVISAHYGKPAEKSFFFGCSNGGRQALHEAQRYPADFDAIVAGAPALDFARVTTTFVEIVRRMYPDPAALSTPAVSPADRALLHAAILARCDASDGLADGMLLDPTSCDFDPATFACTGAATNGCLAPASLAAIENVYAGPHAGGKQLFPGFPFGAENIDANGWGSWLTGGTAQADTAPNAAYSFGVGMMRYFVHHDPEWTYASYDAHDYADDLRPVAAALNASDPDLDAFRARGGKLLMYHGWSDLALSGHMSTDYADRVFARDATAQDDLKLFMLPGVLHCAGGPGPSSADWIAELARWHDSGVAPTEVAVTYPDKAGARKVCAWPARPRYAGGGADDVGSWRCE